jgi:hypothetical protein
MDAKSVVHRILKSGRGDFHPLDFESNEDHEKGIAYLEALQSSGIIKIIDRVQESYSGGRRWGSVVVGITKDGKDWLENQN